MSKNMKMIMESWRRNIINEELLLEKSAQEVLALLDQAEENLKDAQDEASRKKLLGKLFVGVSAIGLGMSLAPAIATILAGTGVKVGVLGIITKISKSGFGAFWEALPGDAQEALLDQLPDFKDKLKGQAQELITKLLDIPDEQAAKVEFLRAIDLPDNLDDMLQPNVYDAVIAEIRKKLEEIALYGGELSVPSMELAGELLRNEFGLDVKDVRR